MSKDRQQQAIERGRNDYGAGKPISENYYKHFSNNFSVLCGFWEKGWLNAQEEYLELIKHMLETLSKDELDQTVKYIDQLRGNEP